MDPVDQLAVDLFVGFVAIVVVGSLISAGIVGVLRWFSQSRKSVILHEVGVLRAEVRELRLLLMGDGDPATFDRNVEQLRKRLIDHDAAAAAHSKRRSGKYLGDRSRSST